MWSMRRQGRRRRKWLKWLGSKGRSWSLASTRAAAVDLLQISFREQTLRAPRFTTTRILARHQLLAGAIDVERTVTMYSPWSRSKRPWQLLER